MTMTEEQTLEASTMRKVSWRLMPFLLAAYLLCYIDRVNVGFAALQMNKAVGIDPAVGRRAALGNPSYRATIAWMGEKMVPYLTEQGLIPASGRNRRTWKASFLLPR